MRAMAGSFIIKFRRLREGKTDYKLRKALLKSGKPLFTVRKSNRYIYVSLVKPGVGGDITLFTVCSKVLATKYGWKVGLKNTPAAYLTGLLAGKLATKMGITEAVVNLGLAWSKKASRPFAAAMGAIEAGLKINVGKEVIVDAARIRGEHIANYARYLRKTNEELYKRRFSRYLSAGIDVENLPKLFDKVHELIKRDCV